MHIESSDSAISIKTKTGWWTPQLAGPLIAAAAIRLTLLVLVLARGGSSSLISTDTPSYLDPGRNLLLHGGFVANGVPDLFRTPGYPLFLAITSLAGVPVTAFIQVILSVFSVLLIWRLAGAVIADQRVALGAAWLFAFEPIGITYSVILLSETLFLTLLLLSMERLSTFLHGRSLRVLALSGLWLAAATFVRPVTYYLPVALAVGLFVVLWRERGLRWKAPAVLLISVLPWLGAWQIRNWAETGYTGFCSIKETNPYFFNVPEVIAGAEHRNYLDVQNQTVGYVCGQGCDEQLYLYAPYLALHPEQAGWSLGRRLAFMSAETSRILGAHRGVYLRSCTKVMLKVAFRLGSGNFDQLLYPGSPSLVVTSFSGEGPSISWLMLAKEYPWIAVEKLTFGIVMVGLYVLAARGIYLVARGAYRDRIHGGCLWLLLGTSLYFLAVIGVGGGSTADSRLRLPIMITVCILSSAGVRRSNTIAQ